MSQRLYSSQDDLFIREHYKTLTHEQMGKALDRPRGSISKRVCYLKLSTPATRGRRYTAREDRILKARAGKDSHKVIAADLGRTVASIRGRMRILKIDAVHRGESHWAAKYDNMQALMIGCLHDCGFTATEIFRLLTCTQEISSATVNDIVSCRTRRRAA